MKGGARANSPALFGPAPRGKVEVKLGRGAQIYFIRFTHINFA